jgi:hypothetical protein
MRFRFVLPALQMVAMLLIVWATWAPGAHEIRFVPSTGTEPRSWMLIPSPIAVEWAEAINLPSAAIMIPAEFGLRGADALPNYKLRRYGFWIVGLLCWYMVGRFVDDLVQWRRRRALPRKNPGDLTFALLAVPSALLLGGAFLFGDSNSRVLAAWSAIWIVITCSALVFRVAQEIQQRRKMPMHR